MVCEDPPSPAAALEMGAQPSWRVLAFGAVERTASPRLRQPRRNTRDSFLRARLTGPLLGPLHMTPDLLLIGAARAGTSFLWGNLRRHPAFRSAAHKELHFFDTNRYRLGMGWYRRQFPLRSAQLAARVAGRPFKTGEATPRYLWHAGAPARVARSLPDVRLIALLRHPVERAYSHWAYARGRGQALPPFDEVVDRELSEGVDDSDTGYLARGIYVDQLERWRQHFPSERLLVIQSERLFGEPELGWAAVQRYLDLPLTLLPASDARNTSRGEEPLSTVTRDRLEAFYRPHNERLFAFLGERYDW